MIITLPILRIKLEIDSVPTRVLVVDDDVEMTDLLKIVLEPNAFQVMAANSGREGVELARDTSPDVIVLDLLMPDMDGWQVCSEIRKFSQAPILILSAINKPGLAVQALDSGADDFLLKPMPSGVLIAHLKMLTRRSRAGQIDKQTKLNYYL